jgi:hypothetical protein
MSLPSCVPEDMGATVNWLLTSQHASGDWAHDAPTAQETAFVLLGLLKYHREVHTHPMSPYTGPPVA